MLTLLSLAALLTGTAYAVDDTYTHSFRLIDTTGTPIEGEQSVSVRLTSDAAGTAELWTSTYTVDLHSGHGAVVLDLGDEGAIDPSWFDDDVFIEVSAATVTYGPEAVRAVPYASVAGRLAGGGTGRTLVLDGGVSTWSDGSGAPSCLAYRYPTAPDAYSGAGAQGNGLYRLDSDGAGPRPAYDAYCDMTTDGGGWTLTATIYDDDGGSTENWHSFSEHWARGGAFGSQADDPAEQADGRSRAFGEVSGNELMLYYNGSPFLRTTNTSSCLGNSSMLRTFGQVYWNQEMWLSCAVGFHDTGLGEKALSCTGGVSSCGTISELRIGWGEDEHQNTANSDQAMISSDRRQSVSTVGGLGSRKSDSGHQCGSCIFGDVSADTDAPSNIAGPQLYGLFIR